MKYFFGTFLALSVVVAGTIIYMSVDFSPIEYQENTGSVTTIETRVEEVIDAGDEEAKHQPLETPEHVRAIYMSSCVVGTESFRNDLVNLVEETELNALVIDVKDYSGTLSFRPENKELTSMWQKANCGAGDMKEFLEELQQKEIYTVARVTVFQDPFFAEVNPSVAVQSKSSGGLWSDRKGAHYLDPGSKKVWDRTVAIAEEAHAVGFDEINFDYIRYPSDGVMGDMLLPITGNESRAKTLESFFDYLHKQMTERGIVTSADLFGIVMSSNGDAETIGQVLERAVPYFDYIAPMVYPSHYPPGFNGYPNPNLVPYQIIEYSLSSAIEKIEACKPEPTVQTVEEVLPDGTVKTNTVTVPAQERNLPYVCGDRAVLRPWYQDFDYGGEYGSEEIRAQIQAGYDLGIYDWMLWAPSNRYTKSALESTVDIL